MDWLDLLVVQGTTVFSNTTVQKHQFFSTQLSSQSNSHIHTWLLKKPEPWLDTFVGKVMSLLLNMLSRLVITFLPRSKCLLISWLQSPSAVILELKKIKTVTVSVVSPSICHEGWNYFPHFTCWGKMTYSRSHSRYILRSVLNTFYLYTNV